MIIVFRMKKYVMATITLPFEINEYGSISPLNEYMHIEIANCDELPEKNTTDYADLTQNINALFRGSNVPNSMVKTVKTECDESDQDEPIIEKMNKTLDTEPIEKSPLSIFDLLHIKTEEIKTNLNKKSQNYNTTFKNTHKHSNRFTAKSR